ncbi:hypothetical protein R3P38DRAFT_2850971 [Favolaschia claudopus]|uniref:F-box domain-containing protein n=1 Tax=Favolaschia claudopus TaxID=2862362 RepID=A0AAW0DL89_9AGAR
MLKDSAENSPSASDMLPVSTQSPTPDLLQESQDTAANVAFDELSTESNDHQSQIVTALTLPDDVTSQIFVLCLPNDGRVYPSPTTAPLLLAQICRDWRNVALATCQLWASIYLNFPLPKALCTKFSEKALCVLDAWLSRAKGYPLTLGLDYKTGIEGNFESLLLSMFSEYGDHPGKEIPSAILQFVSAHSARIECLETRFSADHFRQIIPHRASMPLLRTPTAPDSADDTLSDIMAGAPLLRKLHLSQYPSLKFSSRSLDTLEIEDASSIESFFRVLRQFPALTRLNFKLFKFHPAGLPANPMTHRRLTSLHLQGLEATGILSMLVLPNLHHLTLIDYPFFEIILSFVSRSSCNITKLEIGVEKFTAHELSSFLTAFPSLHTLTVDVCPNVNRALECVLSPPSLLPRLTILAVEDSRGCGVNYERLLSLLRERQQTSGIDGRSPIATLHTLRLELLKPYQGTLTDDGEWFDYDYDVDKGDYDDESDETEYSWKPEGDVAGSLEQLIAEGLKFSVKLIDTLDEGRKPKYWPSRSGAKNSARAGR